MCVLVPLTTKTCAFRRHQPTSDPFNTPSQTPTLVSQATLEQHCDWILYTRCLRKAFSQIPGSCPAAQCTRLSYAEITADPEDPIVCLSAPRRVVLSGGMVVEDDLCGPCRRWRDVEMTEVLNIGRRKHV